MKVSLSDFRCFHQPYPVDIRPLTILVGQNSAGKTSFLSAIRFLLDLFSQRRQASFNREPFFLGAYEQIAHTRGGRFGRAKTFSFTIDRDLPNLTRAIRPRQRNETLRSLYRSAGSRYSFCITFDEFKSQPNIRNISFECGPYKISSEYSDNINVRISTPNISDFIITDEISRDYHDLISMDISYLDFLVRDIRFISSERFDDLSNNQKSELELLSDILLTALRGGGGVVYASSPVRSKPDRTYNPSESTVQPDGSHTPFILAQMHAFDPETWGEFSAQLAEFGRASGLFHSLSIKQVGKSGSGPFQIILDMKNRKSNLIDVGYGVSQILPIITDLVRTNQPAYFLFQQPEVYLHPKAQAELGSFFGQVSRSRRHTIILETHSDYIIDRIRMDIRDEKLRPDDVSLVYFYRDGHDVHISNIRMDELGNVVDAPPNYREFFLQEEMRSVGIQL